MVTLAAYVNVTTVTESAAYARTPPSAMTMKFNSDKYHHADGHNIPEH